MNSFLAQAGLMAAGAIGNAAMQHVGTANKGAQGARALAWSEDPGQIAQPVMQQGFMDEYGQTRLAQNRGNEALAAQGQAAFDLSAQQAGLANQFQNEEFKRGAWRNAQMLKAQNVANQLNNLAQMRQTNAGLIASAMQTGASLASNAGAYNI